MELRRRGKALASKKSERTAAKGLLALDEMRTRLWLLSLIWGGVVFFGATGLYPMGRNRGRGLGGRVCSFHTSEEDVADIMLLAQKAVQFRLVARRIQSTISQLADCILKVPLQRIDNKWSGFLVGLNAVNDKLQC
ncbi:hypothetical protein Droror1_Dr00002228, partial [Drosera rotundifolia]